MSEHPAPSRRSGRLLRVTAALGAAVSLVLAGAAVATAAPTTDGFNADPTRLLDSRIDLPDHPAGPVETFTQVVLPDSVPQNGSALLSVTVVNPTVSGYIKVYPNGTAPPATADVNYIAGATFAQEVVVSPGDNGAVNLNLGGNTAAVYLIVDLVGSFPQASYTSLAPAQRVYDTRAPAIGTPAGRKGPGSYFVQLPSAVPSNATAVAVTLTQANATGAGYLSARSSTTSNGTSSLNFTPTSIASNLVWVKPVDGRFVVAVGASSTDIIVDVKGYSTSDRVPAFDALRAADSRINTGGLNGPQGGGVVSVTLPSAVPAGSDYALLNVTVVNPTIAGYVASYKAAPGALQISNINYTSGSTVAGFLLAPIGADGKASFFIYSQSNVVVDVEGYVRNLANDD